MSNDLAREQIEMQTGRLRCTANSL